jgi:hypothetical protein
MAPSRLEDQENGLEINLSPAVIATDPVPLDDAHQLADFTE